VNQESLFEFVRREPFQPFAIRMSNGEMHEVHHPECIVVGKNKAVVYHAEDDRFVFCALIHINTVEMLQPS